MRIWLAVLLSAAVSSAAAGAAAEVNFAATLEGSMPVGALGDKDNIIDPSAHGWAGSGGGAETGFGFSLEIEKRVSRIGFVGFRFGYVEHGAGADGVRDFINSELAAAESGSQVTALDAQWKSAFLCFPIRFIARDFSRGNAYVRLDIGWAKVGYILDGTLASEAPAAEQAIRADCNMGNHFFFGVGLGADFQLGERLAVVAEVRYGNILMSGAEATATIAGLSLRSVQNFNMQTVQIAVGVRLPISGI
jgi:opacity protein-like surface antigen